MTESDRILFAALNEVLAPKRQLKAWTGWNHGGRFGVATLEPAEDLKGRLVWTKKLGPLDGSFATPEDLHATHGPLPHLSEVLGREVGPEEDDVQPDHVVAAQPARFAKKPAWREALSTGGVRHADLHEWLGDRAWRRIDHNKEAHRDGDSIHIRLHNTDVVTVHPDDSYTVRSGGWNTPTTRRTIEEFTGLTAHSKKGVLHVGGQPLEDGAKFNEPVLNPRTHADFLKKILSEADERSNQLVYSDWLEEQGHGGAAEHVRRVASAGGGPFSGLFETNGDPRPAYSHHFKPDYHPAVDMYTGLPWEDGEKRYIVRLMAKIPGGPRRYAGWVNAYRPEEAHRIVSGMPKIPGAEQAREELERSHPWVKKTEPESEPEFDAESFSTAFRDAVHFRAKDQDPYRETVNAEFNRVADELHAKHGVADLDEFKSRDHYGAVLRAVKGDESVAADTVTNLLYGGQLERRHRPGDRLVPVVGTAALFATRHEDQRRSRQLKAGVFADVLGKVKSVESALPSEPTAVRDLNPELVAGDRKYRERLKVKPDEEWADRIGRKVALYPNGVRLKEFAHKHAPVGMVRVANILKSLGATVRHEPNPNAKPSLVVYPPGVEPPAKEHPKAAEYRDLLSQLDRAGSITRLAEKLGITPQALGRRVRKARGVVAAQPQPEQFAKKPAPVAVEGIHPELAFTRLGAILRQHSAEPTDVGALARAVLTSDHAQPLDLTPLRALEDYMQENPEHPLAKRFNWVGLADKAKLDQRLDSLVREHSAAGDHDLQPNYLLNTFNPGRLHPQAADRVGQIRASLHAEIPGLSVDDIDRSAKRVSYRWARKNLQDLYPGSNEIWPEGKDFHDLAAAGDSWMPEETRDTHPEKFARLLPATESKTLHGERKFVHEFADDENRPLCSLALIPRDRTLHVDWIGLQGAGSGEQAGVAGAKHMRSLLPQIAAAYPDHDYLIGRRAGGAHRGDFRGVELAPHREEAEQFAKKVPTPDQVDRLRRRAEKSAAEEESHWDRVGEAIQNLKPHHPELAADLERQHQSDARRVSSAEVTNLLTNLPGVADGRPLNLEDPRTVAVLKLHSAINLHRRAYETFEEHSNTAERAASALRKHEKAATAAAKKSEKDADRKRVKAERKKVLAEAEEREESLRQLWFDHRFEMLDAHPDVNALFDSIIDAGPSFDGDRVRAIQQAAARVSGRLKGLPEHADAVAVARKAGEHATKLLSLRAKEPPEQFGAKPRPRHSEFLAALHRVRSEQQGGLKELATLVARRIGLTPVEVKNAIHDEPTNSTANTTQLLEHGGDHDRVRLAAAWYGLLSQSRSLGILHLHPEGPDTLYSLTVGGSGEELRDALDRHQITQRTLIPHPDGWTVLVLDRASDQGGRVRAFAQSKGVAVKSARGHAELIGGSPEASADPNTRADYRTLIKQLQEGQSSAAV